MLWVGQLQAHVFLFSILYIYFASLFFPSSSSLPDGYVLSSKSDNLAQLQYDSDLLHRLTPGTCWR